MSWDVTLATCRVLPEPDPDMAPLVEALEGAGLSTRVAAWDDEGVDWAPSRLTILRSPWNYYEHYREFIGWAERTAEVCTLLNPIDIIRWSTNKRYLAELASRGLNATPTAYVDRGSDRTLSDICDEHDWSDVVVKPVVSASSFKTHAMMSGAFDDEETFAALCAERDMMVQPFIDSVHTYGERAVVVIDGQITHSVRKSPRASGEDESVSGPHPVDDDVADLVQATLRDFPPLLYARVDVARDAAGAPLIMELELAEPSLFFPMAPAALERYVAGVKRRLG